MNLRELSRSAETHLNDLQADVEAGARYLRQIDERAVAVKNSIAENNVKAVALLHSLLDRIGDLKSYVLQQRTTLRQLWQDIRRVRSVTARIRERIPGPHAT